MDKIWTNDEFHKIPKKERNGRFKFNHGAVIWYKEGKLHREDGPAYIDGENQIWFINGVEHRLDGPAKKWADGSYEWYKNGKCHRLDGPACLYIKDPINNKYEEEYCIEDVTYSYEEWKKLSYAILNNIEVFL